MKHLPLVFAAALGLGGLAQPDASPGAPDRRDPFWPVGYTPPAAQQPLAPAAVVPEEVEPAAEDTSSPLAFNELSAEEQAMVRKHLDVDGVLQQGGRFIAIINEQVVQRGDVLHVQLVNKKYRFRIEQISRNRVELSPVWESSPPEGNPTPGGDT